MRREDVRVEELAKRREKKDSGVNRFNEGEPCPLIMGYDPSRASGVFPIRQREPDDI